jgi:hypothetical protein
LAVAFWVALGSTVAFELAAGVAVALVFFVVPAGACASGVVVWAAPVVPLLRRVENFVAGWSAAVDVRGVAGCGVGCVVAVSGAVAAASSKAAKGPPLLSWEFWVAVGVCGHGEDATAGVALTFDAVLDTAGPLRSLAQ